VEFAEATRRYETWLGRQIRLIPADLRLKHKAMRDSSFGFLRATFYRWAQVFPEVCPREFDSPQLVAVGDLHVENFGTWRDIEGRLIWGINDFDEACRQPYLIDFVRVLTSVALATAENHMELAVGDALEAFVAGYRERMESGGGPIVLAEEHPALGTMAKARLKNPARFWSALTGLPSTRMAIPDDVRRGIKYLLPGKGVESLRYVHRIAGLGSLGRRRFVAIGQWRGALIAREAKELAPSACVWAGWSKNARICYKEVLAHSVRCSDPFVGLYKNWVVRRLAPDCSRIELASLGETRDELRLLRNMGRETANVHLADGRRKRILKDLDRRKASGLLKAVSNMAAQIRKDWKAWKLAQA
jgi:hypothetical protein